MALPATKSEWLLGREDPNSGIVPDVDLTPQGPEAGGVSRRHCIIQQHGSQFTVTDQGAMNGSFVNGIALTPNVPHPLNHGDELKLGKLAMKFYTS